MFKQVSFKAKCYTISQQKKLFYLITKLVIFLFTQF
jgi:hypothetical protein